MLKSWSIQNFKPILDSGELKLAPVTVLAGRNSSGKSSLIQSILMIAQTLSEPLPEPALVLNDRIVQLGTMEDFLCQFSESRKLMIEFELSAEEENEKSHQKWTHKVVVSFHIPNERAKDLPSNYTSDAVLESLSMKSDYYGHNSFDSNLDEFSELFPDSPFEEIMEMAGDSTGPFTCTYEFEAKKLPDEEFSNFMENIINSSRIDIKRSQRSNKPIYLGEFISFSSSTDFSIYDFSENDHEILGDLSDVDLPWDTHSKKQPSPITSSEEKVDDQIVEDENPKEENIAPRYLIDLNHFLPSDLSEVNFKNKKNLKINIKPFNIIDDALKITRFFTRQIRYLGPLRVNPKSAQSIVPFSERLGEVGEDGMYAASAYYFNRLTKIVWFNPNIRQTQQGTLQEALNTWAIYLEVADQVQIESAGSIGMIWKVVLKKNQQARTLPNVGVGISQLLPILVMGLLAPKDTLLLIEQPELHLHPRVQARLGDFFMGLAKCGKQCLIETHSENLVSQLRYYIVEAGGQENSDCLIYFVDQDEQGAAKFEQVDISPQGNILNWPDGFFDETALQEGRITTASLRKRAKKSKNG